MQPENQNDLLQIQRELAEMARFPEMNPGPVCRLDRSGNLLLANSKAKKMFGEKQLTNGNWLQLCDGMTKRTWEEILHCTGIFPFETKVGHSFMLFNHVCTENNEHVFVFGTDITSQKLAEEKLAVQSKELAEIARFPDMNPGPVIRMTLDSVILLSNAAAKNLFGEDITGKRWLDQWPTLAGKKWNEITNASSVVPVEVRISNRDFVFNHKRDFKSDLVFVFGTDITQQKTAERQLAQSEKMATLGTLAAGVAHELNNPAAATRRASQQLRELLNQLEKARENLYDAHLGENETAFMLDLAKRVGETSSHKANLSALERSDQEAYMEECLEEYEVKDPWEIAPAIVAMGFDTATLRANANEFSKDSVKVILEWIGVLFPIYTLLNEINEGSGRISEIVVALKNYSFLGQAPVQQVNVHEGIDNTLVILRSKLKEGITVHREYGDIPDITAYGSELNQVWTNLLDNAADAMKGKGDIFIRTKKTDGNVVIEIEDNGPGIPVEIQSRIFDPFFTTKEPGKGTGLGLSTTYGIITEKHKGSIHVESRPGKTIFRVRLPLHL